SFPFRPVHQEIHELCVSVHVSKISIVSATGLVPRIRLAGSRGSNNLLVSSLPRGLSMSISLLPVKPVNKRKSRRPTSKGHNSCKGQGLLDTSANEGNEGSEKGSKAIEVKLRKSDIDNPAVSLGVYAAGPTALARVARIAFTKSSGTS